MVPSLAWLYTKHVLTAAILCALIVLLTVYERETILTNPTFTYYTRPRSNLLRDQGKFWQRFHADLKTYGPKVPPLVHPEGKKLDIGFDPNNQRARPDYLKMSMNQWEGLGKSHTDFVEKIRSKQYALPYNAGTRGIVTTAGGPYLPVALVSIRMLRETGSMLPVEVFLSKWSEWDPVICGEILPSLNAKCLVLQDVFDYDDTTRKAGLEKYQYKVMAILFSSFEEVLFLDSDCFPVRRANDLFESEPFKSSGLVLWPDFWFPSESPLFFEIASIQAPNVYERASTEAGEILYSKRKQELSLLLAAFYNYYGPNFYYPLTSQGAPGEGDKDTFLWSAVRLDAMPYTVKQKVIALGYHRKDGTFSGSAMAQFDPTQDYHGPAIEDFHNNNTSPRPYFAHVHHPKLDPGQIFESESFGAPGPTKDSEGNMRRIWYDSEEEAVEFFGFDLERIVWRVVREIACEYEGRIQSWKGKKNVCKKATEYWVAVFGG